MVYHIHIMSIENSSDSQYQSNIYNNLLDVLLQIDDIDNKNQNLNQNNYHAYFHIESNNSKTMNNEINHKIQYNMNNESEQIMYYRKINIVQKLELELSSIGLGNYCTATPKEFITYLKSFVGKSQDDFDQNISQYITQESIKFGIPYSCIDSKLNRNGFQKSYIKFICKFHTNKRTSCNSQFKIIINNKIIKDIKFIDIYHNHSLERTYIESKIPLITKDDKIKLREAVQKGLSTPALRKLTNTNLLPQQMYNVIRNDKKDYFSNEILQLQNYVKEIQNKFDVFWKFDENNKFYNLIIINSIIKSCSYANDIVVIDDTMCTNNFDYPFLVFLVFDENNMVQILAISIISSKDEKNFIDIMSSLKTFIPDIRVFLMDRLKSQKNAISKIFPLSKIVYCRLHIERNIIKQIKINNIRDLIQYFRDFLNEKMDKKEYIDKLKNIICDNDKSLKHIHNLINDVDNYDPMVLKSLNLKGHTTTNSIEGTFGNIKRQTEHKIMPLYAVLKLFVNQSDNLIKKNINFKNSDIDKKIYPSSDLGEYAISILNKRYNECVNIFLMLSNEDKTVLFHFLGLFDRSIQLFEFIFKYF